MCVGCGNNIACVCVQVGRSGKNIVPKTEEIQSIDYQFRVESEVTFEWEDTNSIAPSESAPRGIVIVIQCILVEY